MDLFDGCFDGRRHQTMHHFRLVALHEQRIPAATAKELLQFLVLDASEDCRVADLEAIQMQIGRTAPSVIGSRNLLDCQAVAKGPVSASPSPTMQATMSSGLSNAAPKAWLSEYPSSPPS